MTKPPLRFDVATLRDIAGEGPFSRGSTYARQGRVRLMSVQPASVRAQVTGSEIYQAILEGGGRAISGDCECQAFADMGFCKHLVAVALTVNSAAPAELAEASNRHERMRAYLLGVDRDVLAGRLLALAERDEALWRELELEAAVVGGDDEALFQSLADAIDAATDVDEFVDWRGAGTVADDLHGVIGQIGRVLHAGRAALALRALQRFFDEAEPLLLVVDDSNGEASGALAAARELHLQACLAAKPDPAALAAELFERELGSEFGLWEDVSALYAEALGPRGLAEFRRLVETAWRDLAPKRRGERDHDRLMGMLDTLAQQAGEVVARIELRASVAASAWDYLKIAEICLEAGQDAEALRWADEGLWKTEDEPDSRLVVFAARLRRRLGEPGTAEAHLWAEFERAPTAEVYRLLRDDAAQPDAVVDRSAGILRGKIAAGDRSGWRNPADLLVEILLAEGRRDEAWAGADACNEATAEALARSTEESHPDRALGVYERLAERCIAATSNSGYATAMKYVARAARLRAKLGRDAEQVAYLDALAARHKAKRNFIRLLNDPGAWPKTKG